SCRSAVRWPRGSVAPAATAVMPPTRSIPPPLVGGGQGAGFARGSAPEIRSSCGPADRVAGVMTRLPARDPAPYPPPTRGGGMCAFTYLFLRFHSLLAVPLSIGEVANSIYDGRHAAPTARRPPHRLRVRRIPRPPSRDHRSRRRRRRCARADADRRGQVALLSGAGAVPRGCRHRGVAADRAHA